MNLANNPSGGSARGVVSNAACEGMLASPDCECAGFPPAHIPSCGACGPKQALSYPAFELPGAAARRVQQHRRRQQGGRTCPALVERPRAAEQPAVCRGHGHRQTAFHSEKHWGLVLLGAVVSNQRILDMLRMPPPPASQVHAGIVLVQAVGHRRADQHVVELLLADAPVAINVDLPQRPLGLRISMMCSSSAAPRH